MAKRTNASEVQGLRVDEILAQYFATNMSNEAKTSSLKDDSQDKLTEGSSKKSHRKHKKSKKKKKKHSHHKSSDEETETYHIRSSHFHKGNEHKKIRLKSKDEFIDYKQRDGYSSEEIEGSGKDRYNDDDDIKQSTYNDDDTKHSRLRHDSERCSKGDDIKHARLRHDSEKSSSKSRRRKSLDEKHFCHKHRLFKSQISQNIPKLNWLDNEETEEKNDTTKMEKMETNPAPIGEIPKEKRVPSVRQENCSFLNDLKDSSITPTETNLQKANDIPKTDCLLESADCPIGNQVILNDTNVESVPIGPLHSKEVCESNEGSQKSETLNYSLVQPGDSIRQLENVISDVLRNKLENIDKNRDISVSSTLEEISEPGLTISVENKTTAPADTDITASAEENVSEVSLRNVDGKEKEKKGDLTDLTNDLTSDLRLFEDSIPLVKGKPKIFFKDLKPFEANLQTSAFTKEVETPEEGEINDSDDNDEKADDIKDPTEDKKKTKKHKKKKKKHLKSKHKAASRSRSPSIEKYRESGRHFSKSVRRSVSPRHHHYSRKRARSRSISPRPLKVPKKRPLSDLRERIDKKRLLEIARKNVLSMIEKGTLPSGISVQTLAQQQLVNLKAGGKSVEELTEFCKGLVHDKDAFSDSSDDDDDRKHKCLSDDEEAPFIKHPFKLKESAAPIRMNIPNAVQIPVRSTADTAKLRQIFPVSSGNQHRIKELEWIPVEKDEPSSTKKTKEAKPSSTASVTPAIVISEVKQEVVLPPPTVKTHTVKSKASKSSAAGAESMVSAIVAKRLSAVRKLQENPLDIQALSLMYQAQQQMQEWATSKVQPGQFGLGPETRLLTPQELSGPTQVWAKKNQLTNAAPVSEGVGMNLLRKMGWNPGEGLGKNKEGSLVPLMLDVKVDKRGLVSTADVGAHMVQTVPVRIRQDLSGKHPVSALMELCSKRKWGPPEYNLLDEGGPAHRKNFLFKVRIKGVDYQPSVSSPNKKQAKALAAQVCLQTLGLLPRDLNSAI